MTPQEMWYWFQHIRYREQAVKRLFYWLKSSHPVYNRPWWWVIMVTGHPTAWVFAFLAAMLTGIYEILWIPLVLGVLNLWAWLVYRAYRSDTSLAVKFKKYEQ